MSRGGGTPGGVADEVAATEEAVARDFARQLVKMYVRRKREFLQAKSGGDKGASFTPSSGNTPSATPTKVRPPPQSPISAATAPAEAAVAAYAAAAEAAAAAEPHRVPLPLSRASPVREEAENRGAAPGLPPSMMPTYLNTPRSAQIAQLAEENRVLLARLAQMQAAADADTRGEERGRQEAEAQRRKHYGIGEYYNGGSGGGGGGGGRGGDGDGDGGGGSGASTASIATSSLAPPTAPRRAAAATRMLSPRGAPPRRVAVPPPPEPAPEPPVALSGPAAAARARRRSADQLTPMQRRAQARAAELRAEHRALRSAADKDAYFA